VPEYTVDFDKICTNHVERGEASGYLKSCHEGPAGKGIAETFVLTHYLPVLRRRSNQIFAETVSLGSLIRSIVQTVLRRCPHGQF
jgi:hypothetical protein